MARRDDVPYFISINIEIILLYDMHNYNLHNARRVKNDEFYTKYEDIEKEVKHYIKYFKNKVILCNCNDAIHGDFKKYFVDNFGKLGLKTLICTSYGPDAYAEYYDGYNFTRKSLILGGDFRSIEMLDILQEADIVVTNPPFSLFREFIAQLVEYYKKFLVIGPFSALSYKLTYNLLKSKNMWLSKHTNNIHIKFNNQTIIHVIWYTNIGNPQYGDIELTSRYIPDDYPKYDNYDAIEVGSFRKIPHDYYGKMGVPLTFYYVWNPNIFRLCDLIRPKINRKEIFVRLLIERI